jgi:Trypsin-like peptidase domain/Effector-associated domain 1
MARMTDWNDPTNFQLEALLEALLFAYPTPGDIGLMLTLKLNKKYAHYAPANTGYRVALLEVLVQARGDGWLADLVIAALRDKPRSPRLLQLDEVADLTRLPGRSLEAIVRQEGQFQDLYPWIERMARLARSVCRIELPVNQAVGTGWLVANDLILTNWHVARAVIEDKAQEKNLAFRFDYADDQGIQPGTVCKAADDCVIVNSRAGQNERGDGGDEPTTDELDFALLRLRAPPPDAPHGVRVPISLKPSGQLAAGGVVVVVQHPNGAPLKLAIGAERGKSAIGNRFYHDANTVPGSSGSPCLNAKLEIIGLHNAGDTLYPGVIGSPNRNQAVPIGLIAAWLENRSPGVLDHA